jgi:hypothetical protein
MAVTINASTSAGLVQTADTTGNLNIQSNGSTVVAVTSAGAAVTGTLSASGVTTITGAGFTFNGAGFGLFGTSTSGAGIGTTLQSFTFDSSTASGASPHDICATFKNDNSAGQTLIVWNASTSGDAFWEKFYTEQTGSATLRGSIQFNRSGGLTSYNTTSDYRAKDIIGPVVDSGVKIDALKVYEGKMKGATVSRPMLIAHEAQMVAPYAVTGEKDAMNIDGTENLQQMDVSAFVPLLIAEIQSLRARLAALESKQ